MPYSQIHPLTPRKNCPRDRETRENLLQIHAHSMSESSETKEETSNETWSTDDYARGTRLTVLAASLLLGMFLVALDNVSVPLTCRAMGRHI